jgi:hypothetical protein
MPTREFIVDEPSYDLLVSLDQAIEWEKDPRLPATSAVRVGRFDMVELGIALGLATREDTASFTDRLDAHHRMGPSSIRKHTTKDEIVLAFGRGFDTDPIEMHFPFGGRWYPSITHPYGVPMETFSCTKGTDGVAWSVHGQFVPDPRAAFQFEHGFEFDYLWNRQVNMLYLTQTVARQIGSAAPEPSRGVDTPDATEAVVRLIGIGDFSLPTFISEDSFVVNCVFPFRQRQLEIEEHTLRNVAEDDIFGIGYRSPHYEQI